MLNRHELIYEDRETGTGFHGLYYVDLDMPNREPQRLTAGVEGIKEYVTPSGSRFSVIQTASMNGGQYSVDIFTLQRRASKKSPFQITKIISVFNNEGCATSEPQSGCGELAYGLSLSDSSDRHFEIKSKEPPAFIAEPGSMKVKNGKVTLEFPVGLPGNGFLMLRYRLQRNPPGFFLENWGGTVNALQKTTSAMANPLRQNGAPPQSAP